MVSGLPISVATNAHGRDVPHLWLLIFLPCILLLCPSHRFAELEQGTEPAIENSHPNFKDLAGFSLRCTT